VKSAENYLLTINLKLSFRVYSTRNNSTRSGGHTYAQRFDI